MTPPSGHRLVACPTCGASLAWTPASTWRPFCSERCKLIDLGAWAAEKYRVAVVERPDVDPDESVPNPPSPRDD